MTTFIQLHLLTFVPPANLNRDDTGAPKTAIVGGDLRLRLSSQSLKRAWRTSDIFKKRLAGHLGTRTRRIGLDVIKPMLEANFGIPNEKAAQLAKVLMAIYAKPETVAGKELFTKQLAFVGKEEEDALSQLVERAQRDETLMGQLMTAAEEVALDADENEETDEKKKGKKQSKATTKLIASIRDEVLRKTDGMADIAMFGRMLADTPKFNREAAVQVAHAFTTHRVAVEDDYYTAVDDLNSGAEDMGAGFVGEAGFGSGVFYLYLCIDADLLLANLADDKGLAKAALSALIEAATQVAPNGKQNSFASRIRTSYVLAEKGSEQPRTLAAAFAKSVKPQDALETSRKELRDLRQKFAAAYGEGDLRSLEMSVEEGKGSLAEIDAFVTDWA